MLSRVKYSDRHSALARIFSRSASFDPDVDAAVSEIIAEVRARGDDALAEYTRRFDGVRLERLRVSRSAISDALDLLDRALRDVMEQAAANIRDFHVRQRRESWFTDRPDGSILGQRILPIERVGLYVPGGTAAYPSSVLMNVLPAQVAGVQSLAIVSPPGRNGLPSALVLAAAGLLGIEEVYAVGGAQAIAALAYGTETIPSVDKIVGPGNAYVAAAKKMVFGPVAIDSVAGPSEIAILADESAEARHVAADMLSQAEHDPRASSVLVTSSESLARKVEESLAAMTSELPRRTIIDASLKAYGAIILVDDIEQGVECINELAPEHLEIMTADPWAILPKIRHAGAVFLGANTPEPVGDYFAGPNHVLPTGGTARYASALSVDDFVRHQSVIAYSREAIERDGSAIIRFAEAEALDAHALSIRMRLEPADAPVVVESRT
jgi:histidinol dehydrogenase